VNSLTIPTTTKLVSAGPLGAGKTTAIAAIADVPPVSTEMPLATGAIGDKVSTTVAFDFASVRLDGDTTVFLYGLPGQEHFAFMRPVVLEGAFGVVLVLNGADGDTVAQCRYWVRALAEIDASLPLVIGITQTDRNPDFNLTALRRLLRDEGVAAPLFTFDARDREQTAQLVRALLLMLD